MFSYILRQTFEIQQCFPLNFPTGPVENLGNFSANELEWHGVNVAEAFRALGTSYRFTQDQSDLDTASAAWDIVFQYHGRPSGIFGADEHLSGLGANRRSAVTFF